VESSCQLRMDDIHDEVTALGVDQEFRPLGGGGRRFVDGLQKVVQRLQAEGWTSKTPGLSIIGAFSGIAQRYHHCQIGTPQLNEGDRPSDAALPYYWGERKAARVCGGR